jgi:hypothetical protein
MSTSTQVNTIIDQLNAVSSVAKDWLGVEKAAHEVAKDMTTVAELTTALDTLSKFSGALSIAGAGLSIINLFLPSSNTVILQQLQVISKKIDALHKDIDQKFNNLNNEIKISTAHAELFDHINNIETATNDWDILQKALKNATKISRDPAQLPDSTVNDLRNAFNAFNAVTITDDDIAAFSTNLQAFDGDDNILNATYKKTYGSIHALHTLSRYLLSIMIKGWKVSAIQEALSSNNIPLDKSQKYTKNAFFQKVLPNLLKLNPFPKGISNEDYMQQLFDKTSSSSKYRSLQGYIDTVKKQTQRYLNKCAGEWGTHQVKRFIDAGNFSLPQDAWWAATPIKNALVAQYPFVDWVVIVACSEEDTDVCKVTADTPQYSAGENERSLSSLDTIPEDANSKKLILSIYAPTLFSNKYPDYFNDDDRDKINLFVWGFRKEQPLQLTQLTKDVLNKTYYSGYLNPSEDVKDNRDRNETAAKQWERMDEAYKNIDLVNLRNTYNDLFTFPEALPALFIVHQTGMQFTNYDCSQPFAVLDTVNYPWPASGGFYSTAAGHSSFTSSDWADSMVLVLYLGKH